jgi:hypothetical protein
MKLSRWAATAVICSGAVLAHADIEILQGPGDIPGDANVLFNEPGLIGTGNPIQGQTQNPSLTVDFQGDEELTTPAAGQARIEATDGAFTYLSTFLHDGGTYTSLIVNINALTTGQVTFTVDQQVGSPFIQTFDIQGPGENFFRIIATNNQLITKTTFATTSGMQDVRQIRIGGQQPVPEPASVAALGVGVVALIRRRRNRG